GARQFPEAIPVRRLLGPVEPPADPAQSSGPVLAAFGRPGTRAAGDGTRAGRLSWSEFAAAARWADQSATRTGAVPARLPVGRGAVGPNAFLQAAAGALTGWRRTGQPPEAVEIRPVGEEPAIVARDDFSRQRFAASWAIF